DCADVEPTVSAAGSPGWTSGAVGTGSWSAIEPISHPAAQCPGHRFSFIGKHPEIGGQSQVIICSWPLGGSSAATHRGSSRYAAAHRLSRTGEDLGRCR